LDRRSELVKVSPPSPEGRAAGRRRAPLGGLVHEEVLDPRQSKLVVAFPAMVKIGLREERVSPTT